MGVVMPCCRSERAVSLPHCRRMTTSISTTSNLRPAAGAELAAGDARTLLAPSGTPVTASVSVTWTARTTSSPPGAKTDGVPHSADGTVEGRIAVAAVGESDIGVAGGRLPARRSATSASSPSSHSSKVQPRRVSIRANTWRFKRSSSTASTCSP